MAATLSPSGSKRILGSVPKFAITSRVQPSAISGSNPTCEMTFRVATVLSNR